MQDYRVIHLSDLHLSGVRAYNLTNWEICLRSIDAIRPDLVVVGGDMALDDPDFEEDRHFARQQMDRINAPWKAVPGNHDVGDSLPTPYQNQPVTEERVARYRGLYGDDRWSLDVGPWRLLGLNSQLFGSGLPSETAQDEWLGATLAEAGGRPVAIFMHKPLCLDTVDETIATQFCVDAASRQRFLELVADADLRLIASGHTHRFRALASAGIPMVWAPTTAQVNLRMKHPREGMPPQSAGMVQFAFRDDAVEWELVQPDGLVANNITELAAQYGAMRFSPLFQPGDALTPA